MEDINIYSDYESWKKENHDLIKNLVDRKSKTISRFSPVFAVVDYLYDKHKTIHELTEDEEVFFSTGFDYIFDQFHIIQTLLELKFNNDINELEKYAVTINLLLYINEFQAEVLDNPAFTKAEIKPLDDLEDKVDKCLDEKKNAPEEYFAVLSDITTNMFEKHNIELHTMDSIFYEVAVEYNIYQDDDYDMYNAVLNAQIEKTRNTK